ncbi:MAG: winged helix-turn-helix domain-containing protein [Thermoproteota archaeon]
MRRLKGKLRILTLSTCVYDKYTSMKKSTLEKRANRCIHEIVYKMLEAISIEGPKNITSLCEVANIPVDRGLAIVNTLTKYGILANYEYEGNRYYVITEIGYDYLGTYKHLKEIFDPFKK